MHAEFIEECGQFCPSVPELKSMKAGSEAFCSAACENGGEDAAKGRIACASQNELRRLSAQLLTIQESERQRIATDLHDGLGQSLTLIRLALENVTGLLADSEFSEAEVSLQQLKSKVQDAFGELRRVAMDLRPSTLDDLGILATMSWFFREFESACRDIKIEKHLLVQESSIPVPLKIAIFRILQESFSNIVKHAQADHIQVSLKKVGNALQLSIEDDGQGFALDGGGDCPLDKGLGLLSMKERAKFSGGAYWIESTIGQGTRVFVSWPC